MKRECQARQFSDQKHCGRCELVWDTNDPEPPECLTDEEIAKRKGHEAASVILDRLKQQPEEAAKSRAFKYMRDKLIGEAEEMAVRYFGTVPEGNQAERERARQIVETLHDLGC